MIERALIAAAVVVAILVGADQVAPRIEHTFCKISHALQPGATCVTAVGRR